MTGDTPATAGRPRLADLTSPEAGSAIASATLALLPVGSTEQHGPHLAVSTDARIAEAFAERLADALGPSALLCPTLPYGLSQHHEDFPGTVTLTAPAFIETVLALVASLRQQGFARVLVVNGHGGNIDALRIVATRARAELGIRVASLMWARLAADEIAQAAVSDVYGHACEIETSLALALVPDVVRPDLVSAPGDRPAVDALVRPPGAVVDTPLWFLELTRDGALGDPRRASRELGERLVAVALERAAAFARTFSAPEEDRSR